MDTDTLSPDADDRPPGPIPGESVPVPAPVDAAAALIGPTTALAMTSSAEQTSPPSRKACLLSLVPHLRLDEIWMLQRSLAGLDLRTDVFGRLPPELQLIVVDCLSPVDVGCCLNVCRIWRQAFQHEGMCRALSRRCFPALVEYVHDAAAAAVCAATGTPTQQQTTTGGHHHNSIANKIFAETARKYAIRALGRFRYVFRACPVPSLSITDSSGQLPSETKLSWFRRTSSSLPCQRGAGRAGTTGGSLHSSNIDDQDGTAAERPPNYTGFEYAYGRLVWQHIMTTGTSFLVDSLRDGRRLHYKIPSNALRGETYLFSALGDEILVASTGLRLHAWHFESGEHCTAQMPAQVDVVATLGRRICILSLGNVYCWDFGGKVRQVDLAGLDPKHLQPDRDGRLPSYFLLDPLHPDVFFLGNFDIETDNIGFRGHLCFYVHRFEALRYRETFSHRLPFREAAIPAMLIETTARRNVRGLYSLAAWRVSARRGASSTMQFGDSITVHIDEVGSVGFNIYTHTFSESVFKIPRTMIVGPVERHIFPVHIWNDQLLTLIDRHRERGNKVRRSIPLLFAFDDKNSEAAARAPAKPFSAVPLYTGDEGVAAMAATESESTQFFSPLPQRRRRMGINELAPEKPGAWEQTDEDWATNNCLLRYALDVGLTEPDPVTDRPVHVGGYQLQGDDDFLVFGHCHTYTVWSFGEDVVENSRAVEREKG